ncbi:hypothetical protein ACFLZ0_01825 [Patescibacteria group bacterium]
MKKFLNSSVVYLIPGLIFLFSAVRFYFKNDIVGAIINAVAAFFCIMAFFIRRKFLRSQEK